MSNDQGNVKISVLSPHLAVVGMHHSQAPTAVFSQSVNEVGLFPSHIVSMVENGGRRN